MFGFKKVIIITLTAVVITGFIAMIILKQRTAPFVQNLPTNQPESVSPSPITSLMDENGLVGIWHALPMMPSGWAQHYNFYADHTFQLWPNSMSCKNKDSVTMGTWHINNDKLELTATRELISEYDIDPNTCLGEWTKSQTKDINPPVRSVITLSKEKPQTQESATTSFEYASILFGNMRFWKFDNDPTGNKTFPPVSTFVRDGHYEYCPNSAYCNTIDIQTRPSGVTSVTGTAYWQGTSDGNVNTGKISGPLKFSGNKATYNNQECAIDFTFATDNKSIALKEKQSSICGGLNVSFDGVYVMK